MAINRYYTPAQSQPFDPYIVDTATMYGNLRQAGYDNLLAKQQLDVNTQNEIGKTLDSLKAFAPENTEVFIPLNNGGSKTEQSKLPAFYNQITSDIYKGASDIAAKYNNNYTSPEAQKEISDFLNQTKSILPKLQELKNSDKALGEQNKIGEEHLKNTPLDALQGTLGEHVKSVRDKWVNPNDFNFYTSLSAPTKGVNMSEAINKYIGDNLIQNYGREEAEKLGVVVGADGIPTFDISKTNVETRKRLLPELDKLADNFTKTNENHIHNVALEGMQNKELGEGFKDEKDAEKTYLDTFSNKELEFKNRFREFEINDRKTKTDLTSKIVPTDYAEKGGIGLFDPLRNVSIIENPLMDNNVAPEVFEIDDKGNPMTKVINATVSSIGGNMSNTSSKFQGSGTKTIAATKPEDYSKLLYDESKIGETFRNILSIEGVNIIGDVKPTDIPKIQKALKSNKARVYNNMQLATNGYDATQLNVPKLDQTLDNQIYASTLRFNKDQTLPDDLPEKDTKTKSLDGKSFNEWLSKKYDVKIQTDNILANTGQLGKPLGFKRTVLYKDKLDGTVQKLDLYQDSPFKDVNDNPYYNALNEITKYTSSGKDASQIKVPTSNGEFIFELKRTTNNQKNTYDYTGKVYDPNSGTWEKFEDFKKDVTKSALLDVLKNSENVGRNFNNKDINQIEEIYNNTEK